MSTSYPTDLTDEQWELLSVLIPPENPGYRPRCVDLRGVVSAIFGVAYLRDELAFETIEKSLKIW